MTAITLIFILLIAYSFGWKEVAYSFYDIHVGDVIKLRWFCAGMVVSMVLGGSLLLMSSSNVWAIAPEETFLVSAAMVVTVALLWMFKRHYSCMTAFLGTLFAVHVLRGDDLRWTVTAAVLMLVVAPLLSAALSLILLRLFRRGMHAGNTHLMVKYWLVKCLLYVGVPACGIALAYNYSLLIDTLLGQHRILPTDQPLTWLLLAAVCVVSLVPVFLLVSRRRGNGKISNALASLYAQTVTLLVFNIALPASELTPVPIMLSANLLKESNTIAMERDRELKRLINVLTIGAITPLLAFVTTLLIASALHDTVLTLSLLLLVLISSVLVRLYYLQRDKQRSATWRLSNELQHRTEMNEELNRLDVAAVTSHFNSLSMAMDFKQKELINLSLYINQQRDYLTEVEHRLQAIIAKITDEMAKNELSGLLRDLKQSLRLPQEVDALYQEVEEKHRDFVSRLQMRCPTLSPRERRLSILLRLGLSSKEIASMMSLEPKSVEINRYRLRKKLRLSRSENIVRFLQMI